MDFNKINDGITVSGQITPEDIAELKARGFKTLINNRPDQEVTPDLSSEVMGAAASEAGLSYLYLPVIPGQFTPEMITEMAQALRDLEGPIYAYCRSGTRSCTLWGLAQAGAQSPDDILKQAAGAGYDLSHIAAYLAG